MRNLRKIFESLGFFKRDPAIAIKEAMHRMELHVMNADDMILIGRILDVVIAIAEDDAGKAK